MEKKQKEGDGERAAAAARRWVIGVGFWVQGFRLFPWLGVNFFLKDGMGVAASSLQILQASANLPMVAKPLLGLLSDAVPIRGYRRLPYVAIGEPPITHGVLPKSSPAAMIPGDGPGTLVLQSRSPAGGRRGGQVGCRAG